MSPPPNKPFYRQAPIPDLAALARVLCLTSEAELQRLANKAGQMYRRVPLRKKDGTLRIAWDAYRKLKGVQEHIKSRILDKVTYPQYLQGGIRDTRNPRDYVRNASIHAGQAVVINEDISNFFPSISADLVHKIWADVFRFPPDVCDCLTKLTTRDGEVPQGAKTSNHLANLAFYRDEHSLLKHLRSRGLRYSRLTDDITISASRTLSAERMRREIAAVYALMFRASVSPKRRKHAIYRRGQSMRVHSLVVNRCVSLPRAERDLIRAEVHRLAKSRSGTATQSVDESHVLGRLGKLMRLHPVQARRLKRKLLAHQTK